MVHYIYRQIHKKINQELSIKINQVYEMNVNRDFIATIIYHSKNYDKKLLNLLLYYNIKILVKMKKTNKHWILMNKTTNKYIFYDGSFEEILCPMKSISDTIDSTLDTLKRNANSSATSGKTEKLEFTAWAMQKCCKNCPGSGHIIKP